MGAKANSASAEGAAVRANVRALPALSVLGTALYATGLALPLVDVTSTVGRVTVAILLVLSVISVVFIPLIVLVNRPSWAVPPHLRGEPGLIRDLSSTARRR